MPLGPVGLQRGEIASFLGGRAEDLFYHQRACYAAPAGRVGRFVDRDVIVGDYGLDPLDPVVEIEGASGELLQSCRNPSDDHIPPPGARRKNAQEELTMVEELTDSRQAIAKAAGSE